MKDAVFSVFLETLSKAAFSRDKLGAIELAVASNRFSFAQAIAVLKKMAFAKGRRARLLLPC